MAEDDGVFGTLPLQMLAGLRRLILLSVHEPQGVQHKLTHTVGRSGTGRGSAERSETDSRRLPEGWSVATSIYGGGHAMGRLRLAAC